MHTFSRVVISYYDLYELVSILESSITVILLSALRSQYADN